MTALWVVTGAALIIAAAAWLSARRAAHRVAQLSEMYWELKYQQVELRNAVASGAAPNPRGADPAAAAPPPAPRPPADSFIPLESLRR